MNLSVSNLTVLRAQQAGTTGITELELFIQLILFYFGFGIAAGIGNVSVAGGIVRNKKQKSRFHVIVGFLAVARACLAFQFALIALFRFLRTFNLISVVQTRASCHFLHLFLYNASTVELCLLYVLVLDRMMAIAASHRYRRWTCEQAKIVGVTVTLTVSVLKFAPFYFSGRLHDRVKCLNVNSPGRPAFNAYNQHLDLVLAVILLVLYACLMCIVRVHLQRLKAKEEPQLAFRKRTKLIPMLKNMVLVHCTFVLSSKIMLFLSGILPAHAARLVAYGGALLMVDSVANVAILLCVNRDVRRSSLAFLRRESAVCWGDVDEKTMKKAPEMPQGLTHSGPFRSPCLDKTSASEASPSHALHFDASTNQ